MKHLITTALSVSLMAAASAAHAGPANTLPEGFFFKPTIGADYQYTQMEYPGNVFNSGINGDQLAEEAIHGGNLHGGARIHKYVGYEIGYMLTDDAEKDNILGTGLNSTVNLSGWTGDVNGYVPVGGNTELIATAGVSRLRLEYKVPTVGKTIQTETNFRAGGGAQVWLTEKVNVRGLVRYQGADFDGAIEDAVVANLGVNYQF